MGPENVAQCLVKQVGCRVIQSGLPAFFRVDLGGECGRWIIGQAISNVQNV